MTALLAATRALHFVSLMVIFGGSAFAALLSQAKLNGPPVKTTSILFICAATLAICSAIVWFCLIAGQMSGSWQGSIDPSTLELTAFGTRFGRIFVGRGTGLGLLWIMCAVGMRPDRITIPILAGLLLVSLAPISHAAAGGRESPVFGTVNDAMHVLTAGFWLGGLMILALLKVSIGKDSDGRISALRLFSSCGSLIVAVLIVTGLTNAASILPSSERSLHNAYVDVLLLKIGLASIMVVLAATNRWHFVPALRRNEIRAAGYLAVSIWTEIILGMTVVGITGYLGLMAPH